MPSPTAPHSTAQTLYALPETGPRYSTVLPVPGSLSHGQCKSTTKNSLQLCPLPLRFTPAKFLPSSLGDLGQLTLYGRTTDPTRRRSQSLKKCQSRSSSTASTTAMPWDGMGGKQRSSMAACEGPVLHSPLLVLHPTQQLLQFQFLPRVEWSALSWAGRSSSWSTAR